MITPQSTEPAPWTPFSEPHAALAAGLLAVTTAIAAALASKMAAPLFGAMLAVGLGANAGMLAVRVMDERWPWPRAFAWVLDLLGWLVFAALIVHTPLAYPDTVRAVAAGLIALGAAIRLTDHLAQESTMAPGLPIILFFGAAAIAVLWFGGSPALASSPLEAITIAVCFELCAAGSTWLEEAWLKYSSRHNALVERARTRATARYTALHHV